MQLRSTRLTAISSAVKKLFNPISLFSAGEQGVWYDPSDFSTMFQDSAGTTPVTAVEQPVGLMLDKSKGLVLGSELVTNGGFDSASGWNIGAGWSIGSGVATGSSASTDLYTNPTVGYVQGRIYKVQISILSVTAGSLRVWVAGIFGPVLSTVGQHTFYVTAGPNNFMSVLGSNFSGTIDNISVRELPGNHAFQATSTSRPVLSARYNLLTKTEQFDDAVWTKTNSTVTPNADFAPDGTLTADKLVENTAASATHFVQQVPALASGLNLTVSIYAKAAERSWIRLMINANSGPDGSAYFNLSSGTIGNISGGSATITSVGNGWYRCTVTGTTTTINPLVRVLTATANNVQNYTGDDTSGIYIWGADLRVANDALNQPAYQRVNTATDYDTTGFKPYLRFDGTDDWMQTNSINFTATDKMTVFAGVRKIGTADAMILELSAAADSNSGTFYLGGPLAVGSWRYAFLSRGSLNSSASSTDAAYNSPSTDVLTGIGDISGDVATLRIDGLQAATSAANQGTGNYGNYPLYIGRRGGSTLPFNGRLYGLIVRGAQSTAQQIASTETWMNQKTGAY